MALPLAGAKILASDFATIFPLGTDAWTAYVPTLTQGATPTKTVEYAQYMKIGRLVVVQLSLSVTSAGTAANAVVIGLPTASAGFRCQGVGGIFDSSAGLWYHGFANFGGTSTTVVLNPNAFGGALGVSSFAAALASGDIVTAQLTYQSTT